MNILIASIAVYAFVAHVSARGYSPRGGQVAGIGNIGASTRGFAGIPGKHVPGTGGMGTGAGGLGAGKGGFGVTSGGLGAGSGGFGAAPGGLGAGAGGLGEGSSAYGISGLGAVARGPGASSVRGVPGTRRISGPISSYGLGGVRGMSAAGYTTTPKPFAYDYQSVDGQGNVQFKQEMSDNSGNVQGKYGYMDSQGLYRNIQYTADAEGFKAVVQTNEPGTDGKESPADVQMNVEQPPEGVQPQYGAGGYGGLGAAQVGVVGNVGGGGSYGLDVSGGYGRAGNIGGPSGVAPAVSRTYGGVGNIGGLGDFSSTSQGGHVGFPSGGYGGAGTVGVHGFSTGLEEIGTKSSLSRPAGYGNLLGGVPGGGVVEPSGGVPTDTHILNNKAGGSYEKSMGSRPGFGGSGGSTVGIVTGQGVRRGKSGY